MKSLLICLPLVLAPAGARGMSEALALRVDPQHSCSRQGRPGAARTSDVEKLPTVEYQKLLDDPGSFNNKVIRVSGFVISSFELVALYDPGQYPERASMTWVDFGEKYRTSTQKELVEALDSLLFPRDQTLEGKAKITAVGLFEVSADFNDDPKNFRPGFGHMGMYKYRLTIQCIERVEAVKK